MIIYGPHASPEYVIDRIFYQNTTHHNLSFKNPETHHFYKSPKYNLEMYIQKLRIGWRQSKLWLENSFLKQFSASFKNYLYKFD